MASATLQLARALAKGDGTALAPLLVVWRAQRSIALGDLIERFGTGDAVATAIGKLAEPGTSAVLAKCVTGLLAKPADPRIALALVRLVEHAPFTAQSMKDLWTAVFAALVGKHSDPRSTARLERVDIPATFGTTRMATWMQEQIAAALGELRARPVDSGGAAIAKLVPAIAREPVVAAPKPTGRARVEAELLAEIAAAPDDDGPRLVYADLVAERGDVARAELIQLQLAPEESCSSSAAEAKLVAKHAARWLTPISAAIVQKSWRFHRGFLDQVTVFPRKAAATQLAGLHPLWGTLRHAKLAHGVDAMRLLLDPVMRNLRVVEFAGGVRGLVTLLDSSLPIEEIRGLYYHDLASDPAVEHHVRRLTKLPALRVFEVKYATIEQASALWHSGLDREGLELVTVDEPDTVVPLWQRLLASPPKRARAVVSTFGTEARRTGRRALAIRLRHASRGLGDLADVFGLGNQQECLVTRGLVTTIAITAPPDWADEPCVQLPRWGVLGELAAAIAKQAEQLGIAMTITP